MHGWLPGGEHEFWLDAQCVLGNWSWSFCQWSENTGWKGGLQLHWLDRLDDILGHVEQRIHEKCKVHKILICWFWKVVKTFSTNMFVHVSARWVTRPHNTDLQVIFCSIWIWNHIREKNAWGSRCRKNRIFVSKHWEGMKTTQSCRPSSKLPTWRFYCGGWPGSHSVGQIVTQTYLAKTYLCW